MASVNITGINTVNTSWDSRAGAYSPTIGVLTATAQTPITANGTGSQKVFTVAHTLAKRPTVVVMTPAAGVSSAKHKVTVDATNVTVTYSVAPVVGTGNVLFTGMAAW